jgi:hypothetical protein
VHVQVGCYNVAAGSVTTYQSAAQRVIARIYGNASFDTSIALTDALLAPAIFTSVVSTDGQSQFWVSGSQYAGSDTGTVTPQPAGSSGGIRYTTGQPSTASIPIYYQFPVQALTLYNNYLYIGVSFS